MSTSNSIRFMHFSDVHFGVENYGKLDPATGLSTRLIDFRNSLTHCIKSAIEAEVEIAIFTGDAYKSRDPSQTHQREFARCLAQLTEARIPVVLLTGNHDVSNARGRANAIEIFGALASEKLFVIDKPEVSTITTSKNRTVQIAALPYLTKSNTLDTDPLSGSSVQDTLDSVVRRYESSIGQLAALCSQKPELPTIFMGHFSVTSARIGNLQRSYLLNEPEVPKSALTRSEFDYVALGHIHKFQDVNAGRQPPVVYSGSTDRIDFGERTEQKGYVLGELLRGRARYQFVPAPVRPFLEIDLDVRKAENPTEEVLRGLSLEDLDDAVIRLVYKITPEQESIIDERRIHAALSAAFIKVAVRKEVVISNEEIRGLQTAEALYPIDALNHYLNRHPDLAKRREQLIARAETLVNQLIQDEAAE